MATRDFDDVPEDPVVSDIESEKDDFNDETFGVDLDDLEGNEFDFANATNRVLAQQVRPPQNVVTKHAVQGYHHHAGGIESGDSDDHNDGPVHQQQQPQQYNQQMQQQQWNKPLTQRNEGYASNRPAENLNKGIDRRFDNPNQNRHPQYFSGPDNRSPQQQQQQQQQNQQQQHPFRLNFAALSSSTQEQQHIHRGNYEEGQGNEHNRRDNYNQNYHQQRDGHNQNQYPQQRSDNNNNQQRDNRDFQPFSYSTGNNYRRPQWDEGEDNGTQNNYQQNRGGYHNSNYNNNGQYRNQQQNWQQRDQYGRNGGYQQRDQFGGNRDGYQNRQHQRFDNAEYDDRQGGQGGYQYRERRQFERRGPYDPYQGLMTWREKLTVLRIQLLQIISDRGSHFDDYYARMVAEKRKEHSLRSGCNAIASPPSQDKGSEPENSDVEDRLNRRPSEVDHPRRQRTVSASTENNGNNNQNFRNRIPIPRLSVVDVQPYKPLAFQGTLGKWTTTTVTRPRQIIDTSSMLHLEDLQETGGRKGESTAKLLIQALGSVERLYDFVLSAEECERLLKLDSQQAPPPDVVPESNVEGALRVGSFQSISAPKPVNPVEVEAHLVAIRRNIALTLCAPTRLALVLAIKKGRKILPRALKTLDRGRFYLTNFDLALQLASVLCEHLPLLIRRETNSAALVAVVTALCAYVKGVIMTRNSMGSPAQSDDFLFTVRAILADKALSTRSPELVTLLASLVSVRK